MRREGERGNVRENVRRVCVKCRAIYDRQITLYRYRYYAGLQIETHLRTGTCPRRQRPREVADEDLSRVPVALSDFERL